MTITPEMKRALAVINQTHLSPWEKSGESNDTLHQLIDLGLAKWIPAIVGPNYLQRTKAGIDALASLGGVQ